MSNDKLVYITGIGQVAEVQALTLSSGKVETLYKQAGFVPYGLSFSHRFNKIAFTEFDPGANMGLVLIDGDIGAIEKVALQLPGEFAHFKGWDPSWFPKEPSLLMSAGSTFFKVSLGGVFSEFPIPTMQEVYTPFIHPDGNPMAQRQ